MLDHEVNGNFDSPRNIALSDLMTTGLLEPPTPNFITSHRMSCPHSQAYPSNTIAHTNGTRTDFFYNLNIYTFFFQESLEHVKLYLME